MEFGRGIWEIGEIRVIGVIIFAICGSYSEIPMKAKVETKRKIIDIIFAADFI